MSRKRFGTLAIILIVAAVLVVGGGIWYYVYHSNTNQVATVPNVATTTPSINPTTTSTQSLAATTSATWYTFQSTDPAFSFQYPATLTIQPTVDVPDGPVSYTDFLLQGGIPYASSTNFQATKFLTGHMETVGNVEAGGNPTEIDVLAGTFASSDIAQYLQGTLPFAPAYELDEEQVGSYTWTHYEDAGMDTFEHYVAQNGNTLVDFDISGLADNQDQSSFMNMLATFSWGTKGAPPSTTAACSTDQYSCPCATGSYCLARGAMCINPASACP